MDINYRGGRKETYDLIAFFLQSLEVISILIVTYFLIELLLRIFALG